MVRSPEIKKMRAALKDIVVPHLKQRGFKGTFPHFRRSSPDKVDLLSFQFSIQSTGGFYICIASCSPDGIVDGSGTRVPTSKLNAPYGVFNGTFRRLSPSDSYDHVFVFKPNPNLKAVYESSPETVSVYHGDGESKYERIALDVLTLIKKNVDEIFEELALEWR